MRARALAGVQRTCSMVLPKARGLMPGSGGATAPAKQAAAAPLRRRPRQAPCAAGGDASSSSGGGEPAQASSSGGGRRLEGTPVEEQLDGLALMRQEFEVGGRPLRVVCPQDVDAVLDRLIASGADGDPYWTRVWPSAIALATELLQRPQLVAGKRVADLGAGLGVAGIAAALAGAAEVVLLDREPLALRCGLMSAAASGVQRVEELPAAAASSIGSGSGGADDAAAERRASSSGASTSGGGSSSVGSTGGGIVRAAVFDWSAPPKLPRFDVVLACDVLYEAEAVSPIAALVPQLLRPSEGLLLLADPPNRTAANRERFLQLLREGPTPFAVDECYEHSCAVKQIDPELRGGVTSETVAVQFLALRRALGNDTVGVKALLPPTPVR